MAKDAILRLQDTAQKLIQQQKDLTVKPSESATMVANAKNKKGSGQANSLSGSTNIILEAKLSHRHKKMMAQSGGAQGTPGQASTNKQTEDAKSKMKKGGKANEERKEDDEWLNELVRVKDLWER